jgi:hypothetical protein
MGKLSTLAVQHGTDKWNHHFYTEHYEKTLSHLEHEEFNLLEIGIGGYEFPDKGGASLRMWADYFTKARIVGFDLYDKSKIDIRNRNIIAVQGDQYNEDDLKKLDKEHGLFQVIVDDGSHQNSHQIKSFETLFPLMPEGGIYIIEDTETSYWKDYGGTTDIWDIIGNPSCLAYFIYKIHELHYRTNGISKHDPFTDHIESIQFFNNIIIIRKGYNA